jgi:outer membrane protein OmpA-like peptidoglycan-associated protein
MLAIATALVSGCSSIEKSEALIEAEEIYRQAREDETVLRYARPELEQAEQALYRAAQAETEEDMASLAYVGKTRTQTAVAVAGRKEAKAKLQELSKVKDVERLKARELEIAHELEARQKAQKEAENLREELAALQAVKTDRGMVMTLGDVLFATGKADLQPGAMSTIDRLAEFLAEYPEKTVLIEGHTDSTGSESFNQGLSERRAMAVKTALIQSAVDPARIATVGYGQTRPIADNNSPEGRLKNRRVEIVIKN